MNRNGRALRADVRGSRAFTLIPVAMMMMLASGCGAEEAQLNSGDAATQVPQTSRGDASDPQGTVPNGEERLILVASEYGSKFLASDGIGTYRILSARCTDLVSERDWSSMVAGSNEVFSTMITADAAQLQMGRPSIVEFGEVTAEVEMPVIDPDGSSEYLSLQSTAWVLEGGQWRSDWCG